MKKTVVLGADLLGDLPIDVAHEESELLWVADVQDPMDMVREAYPENHLHLVDPSVSSEDAPDDLVDLL